MASAVHQIFGYTGSLGSIISARSRREPKYSKEKQTRMIRAILSRRMMSPPSYEEVSDYVDSQVTYAENKREVLAVFGERSRRGQITNKDLQEMHCTSLHNQCASNGLETCQIACDECKNPAACKKADKIAKEIKKHGRELTGFERLQAAKAKEAKRAPKKAKYSTGQIVKCREGYDLQCGFSGARKITQVKAYPDYVMYGIKGKLQGFVEEEWVVGVTVKPTKAKEAKKITRILKESTVNGWRYAKIINDEYAGSLELWDMGHGEYKIENIHVEPKFRRQGVASELVKVVTKDFASYKKLKWGMQTGEGAALKKKLDVEMGKKRKTTKKRVLKPTITPKKKSVYVMFKGVKKHRMRCPICGRSGHEDFCMVHSDVKALDLETSKKVQKLTTGLMKAQKKWAEDVKKRLPAKPVLKEKKKTPKPKPAKVTKPPKKTTREKMSNGVKVVKHKLKKPTGIALHLKALTKNQQALLRKYRFVDVSIQGKMYHITKQNVKDGKVEWYKKNGKVCLKSKR